MLHIEGQNQKGAHGKLFKRPRNVQPVAFQAAGINGALAGVNVHAVAQKGACCLAVVPVAVRNKAAFQLSHTEAASYLDCL